MRVVAAGQHHRAVAWGANGSGQLGVGDELDHPEPALLAALTDDLVAVVSSHQHTAFVTASGGLLTCGSSEHAQLGHSDGECSTIPRPVAGLSGVPICAVACGSKHTLALSVAGAVYAWGAGTFGALGLGDEVRGQQSRPLKVSLTLPAVAVACGVYHSVALMESGNVMAWGWGRHGQLGDGKEGTHAFIPNKVRGLEGCRIASVCSGGHHVFARSTDAACLVWGAGSSGQLGLGDAQNRSRPVQLPPSSLRSCAVLEAACGERHTAVLVEGGAVFAWGYGVDSPVAGQPVLLPSLSHKAIRSLSCGARSVAALTDDGRVLWCEGGDTHRVVFGTSAVDAFGTCVAIACGTDHAVALVAPQSGSVASLDNSLLCSNPEPQAHAPGINRISPPERWAKLAYRLLRGQSGVPLRVMLSGLDDLIKRVEEQRHEVMRSRQQTEIEERVRARDVAELRRGRDENSRRIERLSVATTVLTSELQRMDAEKQAARLLALEEACVEDAQRRASLRQSSHAARQQAGRALRTWIANEDSRCLHRSMSVWIAVSERISKESAAQARQENEETMAIVRRCYATDKLGSALGVTAAMPARKAWSRWWLAACAIDGTETASDVAHLRAELSEELRQNAALQQRVTTLELAAAASDGRASIERSEAERLSREREVREARRHAAVARGHAEQLEKELAAAHRKLDTLQSLRSVMPSQDVQAEASVLRVEVDALRRFAALAGGAHRFARWRLFLYAMQRKRAEHRAALAHAARRPAVETPRDVVADFFATRLAPQRRRALRLLVLESSPREACARALWRWWASSMGKSAAAALRLAAATAAADAVGPAEASAAAAREEVLRLRSERDSGADAESMLQEAIKVGDAQTRRVLQLQRAVGATRRTLAGCLLRSSLAASGRGRCAQALRQWNVALHHLERQRATAAARSARHEAEKARGTARTAEGIAKEAHDAAVRDLEAMKRKLLAAERSRSTLRSEATSLAAELESERRSAAAMRDDFDHKVALLERSKASYGVRIKELDVVRGERAELESQLRALRSKLRASLLPPPPSPVGHAGSPALLGVDAHGMHESATPPRDLGMVQSRLAEAERTARLAKVLLHARSRIGRSSQLLRLLASLRDWWEATVLILRLQSH